MRRVQSENLGDDVYINDDINVTRPSFNCRHESFFLCSSQRTTQRVWGLLCKRAYKCTVLLFWTGSKDCAEFQLHRRSHERGRMDQLGRRSRGTVPGRLSALQTLYLHARLSILRELYLGDCRFYRHCTCMGDCPFSGNCTWETVGSTDTVLACETVHSPGTVPGRLSVERAACRYVRPHASTALPASLEESDLRHPIEVFSGQYQIFYRVNKCNVNLKCERCRRGAHLLV